MAGTRRRYSDEERADALVTLDACGGNLTKAAKMAGVPVMTLAHWRDGAVSDGVTELRSVKREALADRLDSLAHQLLDALPDKIGEASLKDTAVSLGVAVDKALVLRGEANSISKTINDSDPNDARRELLELLFPRGVGSSPAAPASGGLTASAGADRASVPPAGGGGCVH